ncbi:MAG: glycoside hydrolase family 15 protein [Acidimicrobiales bacterium]
MALRIEDYGLIGDAHTAAIVGRDGSIDWLCLPRFDSDACFARLVGDENNGFWRIAPRESPLPGRGKPKLADRRRYIEKTLVLETEFDTSSGTVRITDFMPRRDQFPEVVRLVEGVSGTVEMRMDLTIRFGSGNVVPWVRRLGAVLAAIAGPDALALWTPVRTEGEQLTTVAEFTVSEGHSVPFVLAWHPSNLPPPRPTDATYAMRQTTRWWKDWSSLALTGDDEWSEAVQRSAITLKALTYEPTGGIVAAPTTSLPEAIGGGRNWDYRFCWLRDATLTLSSLMSAGYLDEALAWRDWLLRAVAGDASKLQILYGVGGERDLFEREIDWLSGYEGSTPVRFGNAAAEQFQLDVYGEVMSTLHESRRVGDQAGPAWDLELKLLEFLETGWRQPDDGIWEVRGPRQHFTHSKVFAWVAVDRAIHDIEDFGFEGPLDKLRALRQDIFDEVCAKGYDADRKAFTQCYGSKELDASELMIPMVGFLPATDERVVGTVAAIERELMVDGFVLRYTTSDKVGVDGLSAREGAFLPCSFWLADCYELMGRHDDALAMFKRLLSLRNDLGLLSEEYDPVARRLVGNFPQAFSHIELIDTAINLSRDAEWSDGMTRKQRLQGMRVDFRHRIRNRPRPRPHHPVLHLLHHDGDSESRS